MEVDINTMIVTHVFVPFQGEVNAIKWDPTGSLLASCSDDYTAKVIAYDYELRLLVLHLGI